MTTTNIDNDTLILKTDVLGRVRMPADRREAILDAFEQSGMSGQAFAKQIGVKYTTFATWRQKRQRKGDKYPRKQPCRSAPPQLTFVEAQIEQPTVKSCEGALEVEASGGVKLFVRSQTDVALAVELIRSLNAAQSC